MIFNRPYRLVIIDDDKEILQLIQTQFSKEYNKELLIDCFDDNLQAIDFISKHQVHIVICDIHFPHEDGVYLMEEIINMARGIQVIALSSDHSVLKATQCFTLGVRFFVDKPIEKIRLKNCINKCINHLDDWHQLVVDHLNERV